MNLLTISTRTSFDGLMGLAQRILEFAFSCKGSWS